MHVPEPLRNSPFRMYRRKSLYSGQYGHSSPRPADPAVNKLGGHGASLGPGPGHESKAYMQGLPDGYAPHPGSMQVPGQNYQPYDNPTMQNASRSNQPMISNEFGMPAFELEDARAPFPDMGHENDLTEHEFMETHGGFNWPAPKLQDNAEAAGQLMKARAGEEISEFDNDLRAQMLEIQMAVEQIRADPHSEPHDFGLAIPQDFFEQQEQAINAQYDELQHELLGYGAQMEEIFNAQEALFDVPQAEALSLEQLVESSEMLDEGPMPNDIAEMVDYGDGLMTPEPFEQEMGEGAEQMESMEPYPDQLQHYDGMMAPEMDDEQMQEMMDPLMMPGFYGPMPLGPGPMPGPGPGGP